MSEDLPCDNAEERLEENRRVHPQGMVPEIIEIEFKAAKHLLHRISISII